MAASRPIPIPSSPPVASLASLMPFLVVCTVLVLRPAAPAHAQDHEDHAAHTAPYADLTDRAIKALSTEEAAGLLAGEGLGFALAAELNGVPGPLHTLEMATELDLSDDQVRTVRSIEIRMRERARELGARIVDLEGELDRRFAHGHMTMADLERLTSDIALARGELRAVHLSAHLETSTLLAATQIESYQRLRGYGSPPPP